MRLMLSLVIALALPLPQSASPVPNATHPDARVWVGHYEEYEQFLKSAEIDHFSTPKNGVTGGTRHAYFKAGGLAAGGALRNLRPGLRDGYYESYKSEVAAYRLDRLLELNMVPPAIERSYNGERVSLQLWAEDVKDLHTIKAEKRPFPQTAEMSRQLGRQRVFDDLVANIDENETNLLFDASWNVVKIDCSRCFTGTLNLPFEVGKVALRIDRDFYDRMKALDRDTLKREIGDYVEGGMVDALLVRRDDIVKKFEKLAKEKGEAQVFLR